MPTDPLVAALRGAGCVFAEEEAEVLRSHAHDAAHLKHLLRARLDGAPLEQVVGRVDFRGLRLQVGPGVFVPRQRSTLLADAAVGAVKAHCARAEERAAPARFVEAFCGVAPIAATIRAEVLDAQTHGTDVDTAALEYARANLGGSAGVHTGSVLEGLPANLRGRVDVIAAVPPYVPDAQADLLPREARDSEPHSALFGGEDGLDLVRELVAQAAGWSAPGGILLVELNTAQAASACRAGHRHGYRTSWRPETDGHTVVVAFEAPRTG